MLQKDIQMDFWYTEHCAKNPKGVWFDAFVNKPREVDDTM